MATTPEGKVKALAKKVLANSKRWGYIYYNFPVPAGYGTPTLDCLGCYRGRFFAIEFKAPGKKPTPRQLLTIEQMCDAGAAVFVVDGEETLRQFEGWLYAISTGDDRS